MSIAVTDHAIARFRERFCRRYEPWQCAKLIEAAIYESVEASKKIKRKIRQIAPLDEWTWYRYHSESSLVFVCQPDGDVLRVLTVYPVI